MHYSDHEQRKMDTDYGTRLDKRERDTRRARESALRGRRESALAFARRWFGPHWLPPAEILAHKGLSGEEQACHQNIFEEVERLADLFEECAEKARRAGHDASAAPPDTAAIKEKLMVVESGRDGFGPADQHVTNWYRNPEGPAAVAEIERLEKELARANKLLGDYKKAEEILATSLRESEARIAEIDENLNEAVRRFHSVTVHRSHFVVERQQRECDLRRDLAAANARIDELGRERDAASRRVVSLEIERDAACDYVALARTQEGSWRAQEGKLHGALAAAKAQISELEGPPTDAQVEAAAYCVRNYDGDWADVRAALIAAQRERNSAAESRGGTHV